MIRPQILMCPPEHYGIEYEINPWMSRRRPADRDSAQRQWEALRALLEKAGATIHLIDPVRGLPDLVFTANAALVYQKRIILARFRHEVRQREAPVNEAWFHAHGFPTESLPENAFHEGAGDGLFCGDTLYCGYRFRSDARGCQRLGAMLGVRVLPLELVDPYYYHLDTCFCPLSPGVAMYHPGAFDDYARRTVAASIKDLIQVEPAEAYRFACNAVVVGKTVVLNSGCPRLSQTLKGYGFEVWETPLDEFVKAGGSAKCLTLRLDGEEAAGWRKVDAWQPATTESE